MKKEVINNEFDHSNIIPTSDAVLYLVKYCDQMNQYLKKMIDEDKEKNKKLKEEYQEYKYKKHYGQGLEIYIREKKYNNINCKDYSSFLSAVNAGNLTNIDYMSITLDLSFYRGTGSNLDECENTFKIIFEPFKTTFARKSNHNDDLMNQIESQINEILKKFPKINSIFCTKEEK